MPKKTIIIILVALVVLIGAWSLSHKVVPVIQTPSLNSQSANQVQPVTSNNTISPTRGNLSTLSASNSDAALNQDLSSVDAQMSGLNTDNVSADKGLSNPNQ